jgi:hypothetical protein
MLCHNPAMEICSSCVNHGSKSFNTVRWYAHRPSDVKLIIAAFERVHLTGSANTRSQIAFDSSRCLFLVLNLQFTTLNGT